MFRLISDALSKVHGKHFPFIIMLIAYWGDKSKCQLCTDLPKLPDPARMSAEGTAVSRSTVKGTALPFPSQPREKGHHMQKSQRLHSFQRFCHHRGDGVQVRSVSLSRKEYFLPVLARRKSWKTQNGRSVKWTLYRPHGGQSQSAIYPTRSKSRDFASLCCLSSVVPFSLAHIPGKCR